MALPELLEFEELALGAWAGANAFWSCLMCCATWVCCGLLG